MLSAAALVALAAVSPVTSPPRAEAESRPAPAVVLRPSYEDAMTSIPAPPRRSADATDAFTMNAQVSYASLVPGEQFPPEAVAAVQAAIDVWRQILTSSVTVTIQVNWRHFEADVLAGAGPTEYYKNFDNAPVANTYYASALAEAIAGHALAGSDPDIQIDIQNRTDWSYDTDGTPVAGKFDLETTIMHELGHGWGFLGTMNVAGGVGSWGLPTDTETPDIYDRFAENNAGGKLLATYPNHSTQLAAALQSNALYFSSPQSNQGTDRLRLFAPTSWLAGSSFAHLSESSYPAGSPESLMTPYIDRAEVLHNPGPRTLCVLEALGWQTPQVCPVGSSPQQTQVQGSTWYADGTTSKSGPSASVITAYASGALAGGSFKLVTGNDGGTGQPCRFAVQPVNASVRVASSRGFIPNTTGVINRPPGTWQVCFRQEGSADPLKVTAVTTFTVTS